MTVVVTAIGEDARARDRDRLQQGTKLVAEFPAAASSPEQSERRLRGPGSAPTPA